MPLNIDVTQILLHMLNFVILAGGLIFLLYKPVKRFMEERQAHFDERARTGAEQAEQNAALKAEYETRLKNAEAEIAQMKHKAAEEAAGTAKEYMDAAKEKAAKLISDAETEAENRKEHILESAQTEIGEMVIEATWKLLNKQGTPERSRELYDEFIDCVTQKEN